VKTIVSGASGARRKPAREWRTSWLTEAMRAAMEDKRRLTLPSFDATGDAVAFET
jgi:hypothetical protein